MTLRKLLWLMSAAACLLALPTIIRAAIAPGGPIDPNFSVPYAESGNWWDISRPGEGLMLERQGNTVGIILFTYTANGEPDFYLATAQLTMRLFAGDPPVVIGGGASNYIAHGTLFRFKNGPILNSDRRYSESDPPASEAEPVGIINAAIQPLTDTLQVQIFLNEDKVPDGSERLTLRQYKKTIFGYTGFGHYIDDAPDALQVKQPCWVDLRGRWVFVDKSNSTARDAWSFNFTELETSAAPKDMTCRDSRYSILADHTLIYRDPASDATLRCVSKGDDPIHNPNFQPEERRCILYMGESAGEPLLWFSVKDVGAKEIIATPGMPPNDYRVWRGFNRDGQITGLRLD